MRDRDVHHAFEGPMHHSADASFSRDWRFYRAESGRWLLSATTTITDHEQKVRFSIPPTEVRFDSDNEAREFVANFRCAMESAARAAAGAKAMDETIGEDSDV